MKNEINEIEIVDYLYGEMSHDDKLSFEIRLESDPSLRSKMKELSITQETFQLADDKEIIPPCFIQTPEKKTKSLWWYHASFKWCSSVAASLLLIVSLAYLLGFTVVKNENHLVIGFGSDKWTEPNMSKEKVQEMIQLAVNTQQKNTIDQMNSFAFEVDSIMSSSESKNRENIMIALSEQKSTTDQVMRMYVSQLNEQNKQMIEDFFLVSNQTQTEYMNSVLADFNQFYQNQRNMDLEMIQSNLGMMQSSYSTRQLEQENMLASLYDIIKTQSK